MQLEVVDILERVGVTCVMVTHDQEEAMTMAGRIAIMNRGKFVQIGEPEEIYEHPLPATALNLSVRLMSLKVYSKSVRKMAWCLIRRGWCIH
ncbi:ABC-type spermidine/putrescine transport systems, ATPase components [Escherichia coli]|uniref:ABC-type spermidine/putrescine transport systems, ATPase components n=1 Tax=Escherichia coli TaxID=562 RepID=A0A376P3H5_ECOLX|nr:ABC-type spermidine/putrescine transport systems, ATPase components [Escherichia coli]